MSGKDNGSDGITSCMVFVLLAIFALPVFGLYLMSQDKTEIKLIGGVLTVVGFAVWIVLAICFG